MSKITVLVVEPSKKPYVKEIEYTLYLGGILALRLLYARTHDLLVHSAENQSCTHPFLFPTRQLLHNSLKPPLPAKPIKHPAGVLLLRQPFKIMLAPFS